jgi:hypothetical protein
MAICKGYLISRRSAVLLVLACSLVPIVLCILMPIIANAKDNSNELANIYPALNLEDNYITKTMVLFVNFSSFIYLGILVFCYCNISVYYYKSLELFQLQTYSIAKSRNLGGYYNNSSKNTKTAKSRSNDDNDLPENFNTTAKLIKSQKIIACLKYSMIIVVFICEILPMSLMHTIVYFYKIPKYAIWDTVSIFLFHCIPLTNPCIILFLHLDTFQEFKILVERIGAKFKK